MFLCYVDESGTSEIPGNTSHFVLAGLSIPIWHWKTCDRQINRIKREYKLETVELHVAWMLRKYHEQTQISGFDSLMYDQRRAEVERFRRTQLYKLQSSNPKRYKQTKKNFAQTDSYIHLTFNERKKAILEVARCVGQWGFARLFAECIDKTHFNPTRVGRDVGESALEQVVSRFQQYLARTQSRMFRRTVGNSSQPIRNLGLLIHDNNETVARKHTEMMRSFHRQGTLWTQIENIIETPLFVDSQLTSMVQIADLCAYGLRRFLENGESEIFNEIFQRAHRRGSIVVGIRHFTNNACTCAICAAHRATPSLPMVETESAETEPSVAEPSDDTSAET
jgi:hypothetical protein